MHPDTKREGCIVYDDTAPAWTLWPYPAATRLRSQDTRRGKGIIGLAIQHLNRANHFTLFHHLNHVNALGPERNAHVLAGSYRSLFLSHKHTRNIVYAYLISTGFGKLYKEEIFNRIGAHLIGYAIFYGIFLINQEYRIGLRV